MPTATKPAAKPAKSSLDLSTLAPTTAEVPKATRATKHRDNPFTQWLAESYEEKSGRQVTVPAENATEVEYLIRRAADELHIGARVVVQDSKGNTLDKDGRKAAKGNVTVLFAGKDRKARKLTEDGKRSTDA